MAKSLVATLIGRAVELGRIDVSMPANIPQWQHPGDPRAAITLDQLLRMNSGLWTDGPGNRTDSLYWGGSTVPETAAAAPLEAAPGSRFNYANNDFLLATYSLMTTLGPDALAFPFKEVLWPLGMTRTTPETDWQGHYVMSSQVWMTARDSARLALLYANDGMFDGKQLLPKGWAGYVSSTRGAQPDDARRPRYGAGFWVSGFAPGAAFRDVRHGGQPRPIRRHRAIRERHRRAARLRSAGGTVRHRPLHTRCAGCVEGRRRPPVGERLRETCTFDMTAIVRPRHDGVPVRTKATPQIGL
jgi:CubicO group peptidase (beta-lactamase class C family)